MADPPPPAQRQDARTGRIARRRRRRGKPGDPQRRAIRQTSAQTPHDPAAAGGAGPAGAAARNLVTATAVTAGPAPGEAAALGAIPPGPLPPAASPPVSAPGVAAPPVMAVAAVDAAAGAARAGVSAPPPPRRGAGEPSRQIYAAIDLGTNNCRLLIARPTAEGFVVIDAFSRVVRLGEGLAQSGRLSDAAMDRALGALRVCGDKLRRRNVHVARSVATEACRRAENGADFVARVRDETGIALDIISAQEEARLAVLGCHILLERGEGPALIFDIGGGSTELVLIEGDAPRILDWVSVPWGVVSLSEMSGPEGADAAARRARYAAMRARVAESFAGFAARVAGRPIGPAPRLLGTSGTVTTLASVHLDLPQYDRAAVDGVIVPAAGMRAISQRLAGMTLAERRDLACIGRERADLVVAGCAILDAILDLWPAERLGVADRGIREGILRGLINARAGPRPAGEAHA